MISATRLVSAAVAIGLLAACSASVATAQTPFPNIKLSGRLHVHGYWFDNQDYVPAPTSVGPESNFFIRRARIQANGQLTDNISLVIQPSFENAGGREPNLRLRDAYIDVRLTPASQRPSVTWRVGQEKRPFSRWELTSSNNLPSIERGAGRGLLGRQTNNLFEANGFLAHDLGTSVIVTAHDAVTLQAGVYNGRGESFSDDNSSKSFGGRGTVNPLPRIAPALSLGVSFFSHDGVVVGAAADSSFRNDAFEIDGQWGRPGEPGLFSLVEYARGKTFSEAKYTISGLTAIAAYHHRLTRTASWLPAIEPAVRFDVADPNADVAGDRATLVSAVLGLYLSSRAQFRVSFERQTFEAGDLDPIAGVRTAMTVNF
jgi:hypothetical protein